MTDVALERLRFCEDERCGQCTPCRVGTEKAVALMTEPGWDEALLADLVRVMGDASICGLGQAAMNPVRMVLKHFREDLFAPGIAPHPLPLPASKEREGPASAGG